MEKGAGLRNRNAVNFSQGIQRKRKGGAADAAPPFPHTSYARKINKAADEASSTANDYPFTASANRRRRQAAPSSMRR